ncbi:MAG: DUF3488 and DUF4129 domain-containing transglutaminase family protein [Acidimicrobiales bacterium]
MSSASGLRLVVAELALFAVTAAVAVGFGRLFDDTGGWLVPLLLTAALAHGTGALLRRLGVGVVLQLAAVGLGTTLLISWIHAPDTLRYLLPTSETLRVVAGALDEALMLYPEARAPTEPITGFVIASMIGVAVVATMSDIAAFRLGAEIQALIPPLTVFVFCSVLGAGDGRVTATIAFTVFAFGFVLVVRALNRGTAATWLPGDDDRGPVALVRLGGSLTAVAALAAVLVGPSLPGAGDEGLWTWRGGGGDGSRVVVNPLVDIRSRIVNQSSEVAFTVESSEPSYWRTMALDDFDGERFTLETTFRTVGGTLLGGGRSGSTTPLEQHIEIGALASPYLPAAYEAARIDTGDEGIRWDDRTSTALLEREGGAYEGLEYTVESLVGVHDPEDLRAAPAEVPSSIADRYLELPEIDQRVVELSESVVADADTPYERALALQDFFRDEFEYSVEVQPGHSDSELVRFLIEDRTGYCEQFSASFAAMARVVGLPSRVAVGFTVGEPSPTEPDRYVVRGEHAHAWPEVWFQGVGWVPFEPTPGRGDPRSERHTGVAADQEGGFGESTTTTTTEAEQGPTPTLDDTLPDVFGDPTDGDASATPGGGDDGLPTPLIAVAAVAGVLAGWVLLVASAVGVGRRVRRRRLGTDPPGLVLAAWAEVVDAARSIAVRPGPTETHREFAIRLAALVRDADSAMRALAEMTSTARYAPDLVLDDEAAQAIDTARLATTAIRASRSRSQRIADRLDPRRALPHRRRTRQRRHAVLTQWAR